MAVVTESAVLNGRTISFETGAVARQANAAILVRTDLDPPALLETCQAIERQFGRRAGRRWGDRTLDLDLLLWSGGCWVDAALTLPLANHLFWRKCSQHRGR